MRNNYLAGMGGEGWTGGSKGGVGLIFGGPGGTSECAKFLPDP